MDPRIVFYGVSAICGIIGYIGGRIDGKRKYTKIDQDYIDGFEAGARACDNEWKEGIKSKRIQIDKYGNVFKIQ